MLTLSWIKIKQKIRHCQGENTVILLKYVKKNLKKKNNELSDEKKMSEALEENTLTVIIKRFLIQFVLEICVETKVIVTTKNTYSWKTLAPCSFKVWSGKSFTKLQFKVWIVAYNS